ncbi:hypothetical protein [Cellulosilyticum sp. I15G10I2]|uniref:hypothetical protein n=1 Tax=Cellulosilyticum sp. I15G10I2 TaxID=1892843 RepID=UPI001495E5C8|nr:hypothetical protein [Cellulosilyticum sp. I15G10I2]
MKKNLSSYILFFAGGLTVVTSIFNFIGRNIGFGLVYLNLAVVYCLLAEMRRNKQ